MSSDEEQVRQQRQAWKAAFEARDVDGIMNFYAPECVIFDIMPPIQFAGAAANRDNWVSFFGQFDGDIIITFAGEKIACSGDLAFVHEFTRIDGTRSGKPFGMWTRETNCLRKIDGRWLILHGHTSIPVDFGTGKPCMDMNPPMAG